MKNTLAILILLICSFSYGQNKTKRALFLGNSYTGVNNLPQIIADIATSMNDVLIFDSNTPGGYTLQGHSTNTTSISKINIGNWDYVILQEQSVIPSSKHSVVDQEFFPFARKLDSLNHVSNFCSETVFYMTWGRKTTNGFCDWPLSCTYQGMDSLTNLRYRMAADSNNSVVSPVGAVWHYIRDNFPSIELYQNDESHPSLAGSYAAACCFYTTMFRKDPTLITFNSSLSASVAANIKNATKLIVYDSLLKWNIGKFDSLMNDTCFATNIIEESQDSFWQVYPNPATTTLTVNFGDKNKKEIIMIYDVSGILIQETEILTTEQIDIEHLPKGMYFIRLKNHHYKTLIFIKN